MPQYRLSSKGNGNCKPHPQKELLWQGDKELRWKFVWLHTEIISICALRTLLGDLWNFVPYIGQPRCSQIGCSASTVRLTCKEDHAEEMRIWPQQFPGFFEWPLLERSCLIFMQNSIWQLGKKSCFSSHAKIHKILDRKVHFYDEGKNLLDNRLFVRFQWCVGTWQGL